MLQIHPQARTTPAVRAELACSSESTGVLARRCGVSDETIRKWGKRGADDCRGSFNERFTGAAFWRPLG